MWKDLPILIRRRARQRAGYGLPSSRLSDRGFDIRGIRDLEAGDTFRSISRRHYARTGERVVIERHPERGAHILFLADVSDSEHVGSDRLKYAASLEFLRLFCEACILKDFTVQFLAFAERIEYESHVISTTHGMDEALETLSDYRSGFPRTNPRKAFSRAAVMAQRMNFPADLICIVSDFLFPLPLHVVIRELDPLRDISDVIAVIIRDKIECALPQIHGSFMMRDAESGEMFRAGGPAGDDIARDLERNDIDTCVLMTSQGADEWFIVLSDFFLSREERW